MKKKVHPHTSTHIRGLILILLEKSIVVKMILRIHLISIEKHLISAELLAGISTLDKINEFDKCFQYYVRPL